MDENRSIEETGDLLAELYRRDFSGKKSGRFRIGRASLALLSGRKTLRQVTIEGIRDSLAEKHGLLLIDLSDEFPVIKEAIMRRYRKATDNVVQAFVADPEDFDVPIDEDDDD
jgi:hypothetical protein